jgi:hypothetical protein
LRRHVLLDACVAAAAYAPKTTTSKNLRDRATRLLRGSTPDFESSLLIPNFCIAEVFSVFEKYRWGGAWNTHVSDRTRLNAREFKLAREHFHASIHNGERLLQMELSRYHILCLDLIAPINAAYQIKRPRKMKGKTKPVHPAGTYDLLFLAMGIWLQKELGNGVLTLVTGDERVAKVAHRARAVSLGQAMRAHLGRVATNLGLAYSPSIYPTVLDLVHASKAELRQAFPNWAPAW